MLELTVRDFGPIKSGTIALRPLTLLIGPNNVGKSYLALLAYALTGAVRRAGTTASELGRVAWPTRVPVAEFDELEASLVELAGGHPRARYEQFDDKTRSALDKVIGGFIRDAAPPLGRELQRCFAAEIGELARRGGSETFAVALRQANPPMELDLSLDAGRLRLKRPRWDLAGQEFDLRHAGEFARELSFKVYRTAILTLFPFLFSRSFYFPAARSGIVQAHRALASSLIGQAPLFGIEHVDFPKLTGAVADFIKNLLELESKPGPTPLADVAKFVESRACQGKVDLQGGAAGFEYPEIYYRCHDHNFPLHRISSMVSELAPIVLFLKYVVDRGDLLIIEEPEAHQHPDNQRVLARAVVRLVRQGVRVLITTHSDYFLEQISNFVRLAGTPDIRRERGYEQDEYLPVDQVGAYLLRFEDDGGSAVHELCVTEEEGIPADEFVRVIEELYDETAALERVTAGR